MHCYVINLPTATTRLDKVGRELVNYCPDVAWSVPQMFVAKEMTEAQFASVYDSSRAWRLHGYEMSKGEIACALSHQSALKTFLDTADECCLVVEDDVICSPAIGRFLRNIEIWLNKRRQTRLCIVLSEAAAIRYWCARKLNDEFRLSKVIDGYGAIAYIVNRAGAETILAANAVPITTTSDHWVFYRRKGLVVLGVNKILAGSNDFGREDSSLSAGRRAMYEATKERRAQISFVKRKMHAVGMRLRQIWWFVSGVNLQGMNRSNERLYLKDQRNN